MSSDSDGIVAGPAPRGEAPDDDGIVSGPASAGAPAGRAAQGVRVRRPSAPPKRGGFFAYIVGARPAAADDPDAAGPAQEAVCYSIVGGCTCSW